MLLSTTMSSGANEEFEPNSDPLVGKIMVAKQMSNYQREAQIVPRSDGAEFPRGRAAVNVIESNLAQ